MSQNMELDAGDLVSRLRGKAKEPLPMDAHALLREAADFISRLSTAPAGDVVVKPLEQMPSREWLRDKIKSDRDDAEVEVRPPGAYALAPTPSPQTSPATVFADAIERAQQTLKHAQVTGENPTSQRALEYRLGELINLLVAPPPAKAGEGEPQHSDKLRQGLQSAVDSINSRPPELRGSFKSRTP